MPPNDPKLCPALERAMPGDRLPSGTTVPERPETVITLFGSREWLPVRVRAWGKDRRGRQVLDCEWFIEGGAWQESFVADPARMRRP